MLLQVDNKPDCRHQQQQCTVFIKPKYTQIEFCFSLQQKEDQHWPIYNMKLNPNSNPCTPKVSTSSFENQMIQLTPQQNQTKNTKKLAKNVHTIANKLLVRNLWSGLKLNSKIDDNPKSENIKNHLKRDHKTPRKKIVLGKKKFKKTRITISNRKENTLPKSCDSASSQGICEAPSPRAILGKRKKFKIIHFYCQSE